MVAIHLPPILVNWKEYPRHGDGTVQFAENGTYPDIVFSPRLTEPELEEFCEKHLDQYEQYFDKNFEAIDLGDDLPPIERFWE